MASSRFFVRRVGMSFAFGPMFVQVRIHEGAPRHPFPELASIAALQSRVIVYETGLASAGRVSNNASHGSSP